MSSPKQTALGHLSKIRQMVDDIQGAIAHPTHETCWLDVLDIAQLQEHVRRVLLCTLSEPTKEEE